MDIIEIEDVATDLALEPRAPPLLVLVGEFSRHFLDGSPARLSPRQIPQNLVDDRKPGAVEIRRVAGRAFVGEIVVERVQDDVGSRHPRGQGGQDFLKVLPRVQNFRHGPVHLSLRRIRGRVDIQQIVSDRGDRDELGLDLDHPEDVVEVVGLIHQQIVGRLAQLRRLVDGGAGRGEGAKQSRLNLRGVPECPGGIAEVEIARDAVSHGRDPEGSGLQVRYPLIQLGEAGLAHGLGIPGCRRRKTVRAGRAEPPAGRIRGLQHIASVARREQIGARGIGRNRGIHQRPRVLFPRQAQRDSGKIGLSGILNAIAIAVFEHMPRDVLRESPGRG